MSVELCHVSVDASTQLQQRSSCSAPAAFGEAKTSRFHSETTSGLMCLCAAAECDASVRALHKHLNMLTALALSASNLITANFPFSPPWDYRYSQLHEPKEVHAGSCGSCVERVGSKESRVPHTLHTHTVY